MKHLDLYIDSGSGKTAFGQGTLSFASQIMSFRSLLLELSPHVSDIGSIILILALLILLPLQDCFREAHG